MRIAMFQLLLAITYLAFISLGIPDGILGAAWPTMYSQLDVPVSSAGFISMTICLGTIIVSLQSDRLTKKFGTGKVTAFSVLLTALALAGFSLSDQFWMLICWALPYGLGAGAIDASLNNFAAIHYASRHMSWLHCMWGLGAALGPVILGIVLTSGGTWHNGYLVIALMQAALTVILFLALPLWRKFENARLADTSGTETAAKITANTEASESTAAPATGTAATPNRPTPFRELIRMPGVKAIMLTFFAYSGVEQTTALWAGSYFVFHDGISPEIAASLVGLFYLGITLGRIVSGFLTMRFSDAKMVRLGACILVGALVFMLLPLGSVTAYSGVFLIGLGCAPIFPCIIHATPIYFGTAHSQAVVGAEMASAYTGTLVLPPLFGALSSVVTVGFLPVYLLFFLIVLVLAHERLIKRFRSR